MAHALIDFSTDYSKTDGDRAKSLVLGNHVRATQNLTKEAIPRFARMQIVVNRLHSSSAL